MARTPASRTYKIRPQIPDGLWDLFCPRSYQKKLMAAFSIDLQTKRPRTKHGVLVWPRRTGKDSTAMFGVAMPAMVFRPGNYFHVFPFFSQARRAIFQEEASFFDRIPPHWQPRPIGTEMFYELTIPGTARKCRYFLLGADDLSTVSKLAGSNPLGVVYSEAAQIDRSVRSILRPALAANGGWELFVSTPRGKNWFYDLYRMALADKDWFCELLTVDQCFRDAKKPDGAAIPEEDGSPVIPVSEIESDRRSGIPEEEIQQEYYCSWEGYAVGTIYGDLLRQARADGRITAVPHDPRKAVAAMLDIGRTDLTAIWFCQMEGSAIRLIDYHAARGMDSTSCIRFLKENKTYRYGRIILPHDARERRFQAARYETVQREFQALFSCPVAVAEKVALSLQINTVRKMFPRFVFDEAKCGREFEPSIPSGLDSLGNYRRPYDPDKKEYGPTPVHDKFSHGASALATGMIAWQEGMGVEGEDGERQRFALTDFSPMDYEHEPEDRYAPR